MAADTKGQPAGLRRRKATEEPKFEPTEPARNMTEKQKEVRGLQLQPNTYWLTRIVLLRSLGFVYCE